MRKKPTLPEPNSEAKAHSQQLVERIKKQINRHGSMSFADFMRNALYTPNLGYYASGLTKIGKGGDFITAPEVSPIFSRCLARQSAQVLSQLEQPNIIEFGAGKGTMAKDILLELEAIEQPIENYYIIELSADLRQKQQETLQKLPLPLYKKVVWLDALPEKPIQGVVLANEVLDAMPVERLKLEPYQSAQARVIWDEEKQSFDWQYMPIAEKKLQKIANGVLEMIGEPTESGYETEVNLNISPWLDAIGDFISKGLVLLVDYGYTRREFYQKSRVMGTLRCHYQHLAHADPFFYPGLQDITAHVDFTSVAESGFDAGFKVAGFTTQAHFLMASGLLEMSTDPEMEITEQIKLAQQIKTLTLPDEMGETFKVIGLTKNFDQSLIGFTMRDLRHQL